MIETPWTISTEEASRLRVLLSDVRDGDVKGVHDARIITRRLREVLPLSQQSLGSSNRSVREEDLKRMGRALGRVRDADVSLELLSYFDDRLPQSAPKEASIRARVARSDRFAEAARIIAGTEKGARAPRKAS